jgi:hypothetical protein
MAVIHNTQAISRKKRYFKRPGNLFLLRQARICLDSIVVEDGYFMQ